jgi:hypothetical protein
VGEVVDVEVAEVGVEALQDVNTGADPGPPDVGSPEVAPGLEVHLVPEDPGRTPGSVDNSRERESSHPLQKYKIHIKIPLKSFPP